MCLSHHSFKITFFQENLMGDKNVQSLQNIVTILCRVSLLFSAKYRYNSLQNIITNLCRVSLQFSAEYHYNSLQNIVTILGRVSLLFSAEYRSYCLQTIDTSYVRIIIYNIFPSLVTTDSLNILNYF